MSLSAQHWIQTLCLETHPEGGWFRETYRASENLAEAALPRRFAGSRVASTAIYFLLESHQVSHFHRIQSDELWHFYAGSPLTIHVLQGSGMLHLPLNAQGDFQQLVPAQSWFGASVNQPDSYSLVGCTVAPGFDFADFEMARREDLLQQFPTQREWILKLT